jgi:hypothetical protein
MPKFTCPHWREGEACVLYEKASWKWRVPVVLLGVAVGLGVPVANLLHSLSKMPPSPAIAPAIYVWGALYAAIGMISALVTLYYERDVYGSLFAAIGLPGAISALGAVATLFPPG